MKPSQLERRVKELVEKIRETPSGNVRFDLQSFSDAEKQLFLKVGDVWAEYERTKNFELLLNDNGLFLKAGTVMLKHVTELYCAIVPSVLTFGIEPEIAKYIFMHHFLNFEADLALHMKRVYAWSEEDRAEYLADLKGKEDFFYRVPSGFNGLTWKDVVRGEDHEGVDEKAEDETETDELDNDAV